MASSNWVESQRARLPDMSERLPAPPASVQNEALMQGIWLFVNGIFDKVAGLDPNQHRSKNKILRALAPALLLGLQLLRKMAIKYILAIAPDAFTKRSDDVSVNEMAVVALWIVQREQKWLQDTPKLKLRANDPNNNHTILDLLKRYQVASPKHWQVALAVDQMEELQDLITKPRMGGRVIVPVTFWGSPPTLATSHKYQETMLVMAEKYLEMSPETKDLVNFDVSESLSQLREIIHLHGL